MNQASVHEIFDFAIKEEQKAFKLYSDFAAIQKKPEMKKVFLEFAEEEKGHMQKLAELKKNWKSASVEKDIPDLKLSDYIVEATPSADMDYQKALTIVMKLEKAAFKMYSDLAASVSDPEAKKILLLMAQEEAKHKLHFEIEYEETFLVEG
jgi:rubrerythrin